MKRICFPAKFHREETDSEYDIKTVYWFAIANAQFRSDRVKVFPFRDLDEVVRTVQKGSIFD